MNFFNKTSSTFSPIHQKLDEMQILSKQSPNEKQSTSFYNLKGINDLFSGYELKDQIFKNCDFSTAKFRSCIFTECVFSDCNFSQCEFININFFNCTFLNCKFDKAYLNDVEAVDCKKMDCSFTDIQLAGKVKGISEKDDTIIYDATKDSYKGEQSIDFSQDLAISDEFNKNYKQFDDGTFLFSHIKKMYYIIKKNFPAWTYIGKDRTFHLGEATLSEKTQNNILSIDLYLDDEKNDVSNIRKSFTRGLSNHSDSNNANIWSITLFCGNESILTESFDFNVREEEQIAFIKNFLDKISNSLAPTVMKRILTCLND